MIRYYDPKDPEEIIIVNVDWGDVLYLDETITSATWTLTNRTNPTEDTSAMIVGEVDFSEHPNANQKIQGGTDGCQYLHRCVINTSTGRKLVQGVEQVVRFGA